jgi:hypothetical protein
MESDPGFFPAFATAAPNGARFDSPGRLALGSGSKKNLRPVGALFQWRHNHRADAGTSPPWGFRFSGRSNPGRPILFELVPRPGLSNLAPLGLGIQLRGLILRPAFRPVASIFLRFLFFCHRRCEREKCNMGRHPSSGSIRRAFTPSASGPRRARPCWSVRGLATR